VIPDFGGRRGAVYIRGIVPKTIRIRAAPVRAGRGRFGQLGLFRPPCALSSPLSCVPSLQCSSRGFRRSIWVPLIYPQGVVSRTLPSFHLPCKPAYCCAFIIDLRQKISPARETIFGFSGKLLKFSGRWVPRFVEAAPMRARKTSARLCTGSVGSPGTGVHPLASQRSGALSSRGPRHSHTRGRDLTTPNLVRGLSATAFFSSGRLRFSSQFLQGIRPLGQSAASRW